MPSQAELDTLPRSPDLEADRSAIASKKAPEPGPRPRERGRSESGSTGRSGAASERTRTPRKPFEGGAPEASQDSGHDRTLHWLIIAGVTLLISSGLVFWLYLQGGAALNRISSLASDGAAHADRLASAATTALQGEQAGFEALVAARQGLIATIDHLNAPDTISAATADMVDALQVVQSRWQVTEPAVQLLANRQGLLASSRAAQEAILAAANPMLEAAGVMAANGRNAARIQAGAAEFMLLTQQLGVHAARDLAPLGAGFGDVRGLQSSLDRMNKALAVIAGGVPQTSSELQAIREQRARFDDYLAIVLADPTSLIRLREAQRQIGTDSETIRGAFTRIRQAAPLVIAGRAWMSIIAAALAIFAALSGLAISRKFLRASELRAAQAERQRAVAQGLEAQAKQTNDLNQAAILRLMNELQEVADGDLTVHATVSEDITGAIADSVNYTIEELRSLVGRINLTAEQVNGASSKARMIAAGLQAATEQQSREIRDTGESVLDMARKIEEVSHRAAESVQVARQSVSASEAGSRAVGHTISGMSVIRDQIQETAKRIKRLGESSQEIGEIVALISNLTDQTNTLALNATIQAASAGEAGRGFTIVAEQVQRLAEQSAAASGQISMLIKTIQSDTQDAVAAMERSTQGVVDGTRRSDEAGRSLDTIRAVSMQLAELIEGFSRTTSRQAESAGSVAQAIQRILLVNEQTSRGTSQTASSIGRLAELAQELKNSVSRFKVA